MTVKKEILFLLLFEQYLLIEDGLYPRNSKDDPIKTDKINYPLSYVLTKSEISYALNIGG